jgi:hypothetical protein
MGRRFLNFNRVYFGRKESGITPKLKDRILFKLTILQTVHIGMREKSMAFKFRILNTDSSQILCVHLCA